MFDPSDAHKWTRQQKNGQSVTGMTFLPASCRRTATGVLIFTFEGISTNLSADTNDRPLFEP